MSPGPQRERDGPIRNSENVQKKVSHAMRGWPCLNVNGASAKKVLHRRRRGLVESDPEEDGAKAVAGYIKREVDALWRRGVVNPWSKIWAGRALERDSKSDQGLKAGKHRAEDRSRAPSRSQENNVLLLSTTRTSGYANQNEHHESQGFSTIKNTMGRGAEVRERGMLS